MPALPDVFCQLIGDRFRIFLIGFRLWNDDHAASRFRTIMAQITDMPGCAADSRILFQLIQISVDRAHWLIRGHRLLAA